MKKNTRIVRVSGIKGLFMILFVGSCLAAGFIAFPSVVAMKCWNYIANFTAIPLLNIWQGLMLWSIIAISGYILNDKKKYLVTFKPTDDKLSDEDIKNILKKVKSGKNSMNSILTANSKKAEMSSDGNEKEKV